MLLIHSGSFVCWTCSNGYFFWLLSLLGHGTLLTSSPSHWRLRSSRMSFKRLRHRSLGVSPSYWVCWFILIPMWTPLTADTVFRSVGSVIFGDPVDSVSRASAFWPRLGIASDRYGRKWPFVVNNIMFIVLELGTGFCQTYKEFLACRALFGIAMGGLYGNAAATALEDCPEAARGLISGILQQGYAFGYLLATVFARALVDTTSHGWRPLFWFGACPPILIIAFRLCLPETKSYRERDALRHANGNITATFMAEGRVALKRHWVILIYLVLLMTGFNFMVGNFRDLDLRFGD